MAKTKAEIDKRYEERHKEERKAKSLVGGRAYRASSRKKST